MFTTFRTEQPKSAGFYVLRYREGHEERVWLDTPTQRYDNVYSYSATYHNGRDKDTCHDLGQYVWVNSWNIRGPVEWRKMGVEEAVEFGNTLFRFGRPSWAHKTGRKVLTPADVV